MKKFAIIFTLFLITFLSGCSSNQKLAKKMIEKYSNNQNYVTLFGEIMEYNKNNVIIKCEELKKYITYEDELSDYYVYSDNFFDLYAGDEICFVTVPFHFYNGHKLPIVELSINGKTLLDFDDGKSNLIDWVSTNFK